VTVLVTAEHQLSASQLQWPGSAQAGSRPGVAQALTASLTASHCCSGTVSAYYGLRGAWYIIDI
jgi:hypothetical protein